MLAVKLGDFAKLRSMGSQLIGGAASGLSMTDRIKTCSPHTDSDVLLQDSRRSPLPVAWQPQQLLPLLGFAIALGWTSLSGPGGDCPLSKWGVALRQCNGGVRGQNSIRPASAELLPPHKALAAVVGTSTFGMTAQAAREGALLFQIAG